MHTLLYLTALQVLLFMTVVLVTIFSQSESLSNYEKAQITSGLEKNRQNGRNIVVTTKDKSSPRMSSSMAQDRLERGVVGSS